MPLRQFIPQIRQLAQNEPSTSSSFSHVLNTALDEILLTSKWCTYKHRELLEDAVRGADVDAEKQIKSWIATKALLGGNDTLDESEIHIATEKREAQIQILLYMLKLSLPEPYTVPTPRELPSTRATKRKRLSTPTTDEEGSPRAILEGHLESFIDRLMMWQMMLPHPEDNQDNESSGETQKDWTQAFCEDVVQPEFSRDLPDMYRLLHTKLFRLSPWTDEEGETDAPPIRALSRVKSSASRADAHPFFLQAAKSTSSKRDSSSHMPSRSRSRSLSISLAQEAQEVEARRASGAKHKRGLEREWSMNRSFKGREKAVPLQDAPESSRMPLQVASGDSRGESSIVLVERTPTKPKTRRSKDVA